jgi:hypothetical protein
MQLDDLKEAWAAHGRDLERSLAIDERLLRKVRFTLAPYALARAMEVALGLAALALALPVLVAHGAEPRYLVMGGALAVYALALAAWSAHLLVSVLRIDYGGPVTTLQRALERVRLAEYRATKWALLGGVVVWLPAVLILFEAVTGLAPLAGIDLAFLGGNLVFGLAVLALGQVLSRKYVERSDLGPRARRLVDELSGRALRVAAGHLDELTRFQREEPR